MEWRIVYVQKPMNYNPRHVEFVEAATKEEAAAIARDRIERRTGIAFNAHLGWAFESVTQVEPVKQTAQVNAGMDEVVNCLQELLEWACQHTSPNDTNSPHHILVRAHEALKNVAAQ